MPFASAISFWPVDIDKPKLFHIDDAIYIVLQRNKEARHLFIGRHDLRLKGEFTDGAHALNSFHHGGLL